MAATAALTTFLAGCSPSTDNNADAQFIAQHGGDPKALDDRFSTDIKIACSDGAGDYLRSIAAHEFKWSDDAKGFTGDKFDKFSKLSAGPGLISEVSDRALLSNGFGAFDPVTFYCLYDTKAKKVVRYSQDDPGLAAEVPVPDTKQSEVAPDAAPSSPAQNDTAPSTQGPPSDAPPMAQGYVPPDAPPMRPNYPAQQDAPSTAPTGNRF